MTSESVIRMNHVTKVYLDFWRRPKVTALNDISLDVKRGTVLGLIGPNGAGKSTTLKILLGLLRPSNGTVEVLGTTAEDIHVKSRIGYLPEDSPLPDFLTVNEALRFYGGLFNLSGAILTTRVDQLIHMLRLDAAKHRPIRELSKGTVRRVGLAQALINDPDLIILDEPTSGMDPAGCRMIKDLILALARRGKTVVLCSHVLADVEGVCHRVALLRAGQICAEGSLADLLTSPDLITLTLPTPTTATLDTLLHTVADLTGAQARVDKPSMSLEDYFLRMTQRGLVSEDATAAGQTPQLAPFLTDA